MRSSTLPARRISLRALLPEAEFHGLAAAASDIAVTACAADSRSVLPGDLFVALVGAHADGHDYVADAVARGARAVLAERYLPHCGVPVCITTDTGTAYGQICQALAGDPSQELKVVGVTGTNGKTTTSWLIASVLEAAGLQCGLLGTIAYSDAQASEPAVLTTPPAPALAHWLSRMRVTGCSHAVLEVSSHALAQSRVAGIRFDGACITNVRRDHLDFHNTVQNYRAAKARLIEQLPPRGFAVLNADDPVSRSFAQLHRGPVLSVGFGEGAQITAEVIERRPSEQTFLLTAGSETIAVRTQMIGDHHVSNCLMAAAVGLLYGVDLADVVRGLEAVECVPGRLERIDCGQPFQVYVDYAHTPDALACVLRGLRAVTAGRLICVFGAGGDRDRSKRAMMGSAVESQAHLAVVTTDNPRREQPAAIVRDLLEGFESPSAARVMLDRAAAIEWALAAAEPGDTLLIAGKGHEDYQVVGTTRYWFDDRDVARRWLYDQAAQSEALFVQTGRSVA